MYIFAKHFFTFLACENSLLPTPPVQNSTFLFYLQKMASFQNIPGANIRLICGFSWKRCLQLFFFKLSFLYRFLFDFSDWGLQTISSHPMLSAPSHYIYCGDCLWFLHVISLLLYASLDFLALFWTFLASLASLISNHLLNISVEMFYINLKYQIQHIQTTLIPPICPNLLLFLDSLSSHPHKRIWEVVLGYFTYILTYLSLVELFISFCVFTLPSSAG